MTWVSLGFILACFGSFWVNLVCFGWFWESLNFIFVRVASFFLVLAIFGLFWVIVSLFLRQFRSPFASFWLVLDRFGLV